MLCPKCGGLVQTVGYDFDEASLDIVAGCVSCKTIFEIHTDCPTYTGLQMFAA